MPSFAKAVRPGLTLIEIMISVSIIAILSAIVFVGFANEQERNGVKRTIEQMQIDVQAIQNRAQSGALLPDGSPVTGYGITLTLGDTDYQRFGDQPGTTPHLLDGSDTVLETRGHYPNVVVSALNLVPAPPQPATDLTIVYDLPDGRLFMTSTPGATTIDVATVILRQTKANLCYSLTIRADSGTVSRRDLAICP